MHCKWYSCLQLVTVAGSLSVKGSRQMLQASSQGSCTPPSTNAAADVKWVSVTLLSSIPNTKTHTKTEPKYSQILQRPRPNLLPKRIPGENTVNPSIPTNQNMLCNAKRILKQVRTTDQKAKFDRVKKKLKQTNKLTDWSKHHTK